MDLQHIQIIWLNFHDVIPNTLREIEFSFNTSLLSTLIFYKQIQVVYYMLKPMGKQSVGIDL